MASTRRTNGTLPNQAMAPLQEAEMSPVTSTLGRDQPGETVRLKDGEEKNENPPYPESYGWGNFRPACLQFLNKPVWVVVFMCVAIVAESMATVGLVSISISTLETRFQLSSHETGFIPSAYECAGLPALIISGFFGGHGHRPRWIAMGMLLLSLGSLLFALPHFLSEPYVYQQGALDTENTCAAAHATGNGSTAGPASCSMSGGQEDLSHYLYIFIAGNTLHGIGGVPLYTLGLTYIDDIASRGTASVYIGIILSLTTLGPAIAFVGAGYLLEIYTDVDVVDTSKVTLSTSDPRWVGAWWIGFLVTFALGILTVIPLSGFPRDMPGAAEQRKLRVLEVHETGEEIPDVHPGVDVNVRDLPRAVRGLLHNPTFVFITLVGAFELFFMAGFGPFVPKYMENMFHISPATAGIITGLLGVPGGAAGSILASVLIKKLRMTCMQMLKWMFVLTVILSFLNVIFLVQCDDLPFAGVNTRYTSYNSSADISLEAPCNADCACSEMSYEPVCGSDNVFYFSPCYAGCSGMSDTDGKGYENCRCVPGGDNGTLSSARPESCTSPCTLLPAYSVLFLVAMMLAYITAMFHLLSLIRVVPETRRSFAVSIDWFFSRLLGGIFGPMVFGAMLDHTCVLWEKNCDGAGSCLYYRNGSMGWYTFLIASCTIACCAIWSFLAWKMYKPPKRRVVGAADDSVNEKEAESSKPEMEMNGNCAVVSV